ncbi:SDR family NAD(P)-dependent oxidoreductase [Nocardia sp. NEAU-G5]|uniref:SDR family NAD(P)-dependent oxidoreductase n=1 Tax=Nocardia albiluteola TaxID=2842303 RepID=A0ABS6B5I4_9NOCA|nr:SDR family NAD(P)-dependent oxidoreductase [Nocardia albiluteola]MBU3062594.1 SDR family NAD(P)-dependent oxidoreductase [Nocardia albiluteola]MBU3065572.1 SDR family NAD(P)-dependent oxidoreductase [Nocardia albiluteola]
MTSTVLVTGAATGIGNLTARRLAQAGHTGYASMLDPGDEHGRELRALADSEGLDLRTVELDVRSDDTASTLPNGFGSHPSLGLQL